MAGLNTNRTLLLIPIESHPDDQPRNLVNFRYSKGECLLRSNLVSADPAERPYLCMTQMDVNDKG